jgi:DNA-binding response OmpR family regulator
VPVVIVSAGGMLALARALDAGCDAVLSKPCSGAVLVATVARLLDHGAGSSIHLPAPAAREVAMGTGAARSYQA